MTANKATPEELVKRLRDEAEWYTGHPSRPDDVDQKEIHDLFVEAADLIESHTELEHAMRNAIIAYDAAIRSCANEPEKMASFCTAQGDNLDTLYAAMIESLVQKKGDTSVPSDMPFINLLEDE